MMSLVVMRVPVLKLSAVRTNFFVTWMLANRPSKRYQGTRPDWDEEWRQVVGSVAGDGLQPSRKQRFNA